MKANPEVADLLSVVFGGGPRVLKLKRTDVAGLIVSTVDTPDCGPETAIIDINGIYPVERYTSHKKAFAGHEKWVKKAKTLKKVTQLGYGKLTRNKQISLKRSK